MEKRLASDSDKKFAYMKTEHEKLLNEIENIKGAHAVEISTRAHDHATESRKLTEELAKVQEEKVAELEAKHSEFIVGLKSELLIEKEAAAEMKAALEAAPALDAFKSLMTELEALKGGQDASLTKLQQELEDSRSANFTLEKDLASAQSEISKIDVRLHALEAELSSVAKDKQVIEDRLHEVKQKTNSDLKTMEEIYTAESEELKIKSERALQGMEQMHGMQLQEREKIIVSCNQRIADLTDAVNEKGLNLLTLSEELEAVKADKGSSINELESLKQELAAVRAEKEATIASVKEELQAAKTGQTELMETTIKDLDRKLQEAQMEYKNSLNAARLEKETTLKAALEHADNEKVLALQENEIALQKAIQSANHEKLALETELNSAKDKLLSSEAHILKKDSTIIKLRKDIESLEADTPALKEQLATAQALLAAKEAALQNAQEVAEANRKVFEARLAEATIANGNEVSSGDKPRSTDHDPGESGEVKHTFTGIVSHPIS